MSNLSDEATTVAEIKSRVLAFARERDWEQFHAPKNLSMALAAEAGELMEHFLWASSEDSRETMKDSRTSTRAEPRERAQRSLALKSWGSMRA